MVRKDPRSVSTRVRQFVTRKRFVYNLSSPEGDEPASQGVVLSGGVS